MGIGTALLYLVLAVIGFMVLFFSFFFIQGVILSIYDEIRDLLNLRPRSITSSYAKEWFWENDKPIRKATWEEKRLL